ncbi:MAG: GNAT family N-acetyltransferase [Rhizobiaceae bacterium]
MTINDLRAKVAAKTLFLVDDNDRVVGCVFARLETGFIYVGKVALLRELASVGIGSAMMEATLTYAKELATDALEVETRLELIEDHAFLSV